MSSNLSSLSEVVGQAAMTLNPLRPEDLASAMTAVLSRPDLKEHLRQQGLARAAQFSWERAARQTMAVYETILNGER